MSGQGTRLQRWMRAWVALCFRHPWWVIGGCLAFMALSGAVALRLRFVGDFVELLPPQTEEVKDLREVEGKAGGGGYLIVQVRGGTPEQRRAFANVWAPRFEQETELVRYVEHRFDVGFFRSRALLLLPAEQLRELKSDLEARIDWERKHANPLYVDLLDTAPPPTLAEIEKKYASEAPRTEYVESKDGQELYMYVKPTGLEADLDFNRRLLARAQAVTAEVSGTFPGLNLQYTGPYVLRIEEDDVMQADLGRASGLALLLALGIILVSSRRPTALVIVTLPVGVGIVFTLAIAQLTIGHLNPITGFLSAILVGLGIEYGVHLSMRYWEERAALETLPALQDAAAGTLSGALTSAITNATAFFVLVFADFTAFQQFGFLAAIGVVSTVTSTYVMAPAILVVAERWRPARKAVPEGAPAPLPASAQRHRPVSLWLLLGTLGSVLLFAGWSATVLKNVSFESDLSKLKGESPATDLDRHISSQLGVIMMPAIVVVDTLEEAKAVTRIIADVRAQGGRRTSFQKAASLNDLVPSDVQARLEAIEGLRQVLRDLPDGLKEGPSGEKIREFLSMLDARAWGPDEVPLEIRRRFSTVQGQGTFVLIFPRYSGYNAEEIKLWADDINVVVKRARAQGIKAHALDGNRIAARIFRIVQADGPFIMLYAGLAVFLMIWFSLRSLRAALLVGVPLYVGMLSLAGVMEIFGLKLNFFNIVVLPNLLTIAVDNSVHLYHRYQEEGPGSLGHVVRTTGLAAMVATFSNAAGYGALLVARHQGLRSLALLAIAGVSCTFVGTTILFPTLLELIERFKARRHQGGSAAADHPGPAAPVAQGDKQ